MPRQLKPKIIISRDLVCIGFISWGTRRTRFCNKGRKSIWATNRGIQCELIPAHIHTEANGLGRPCCVRLPSPVPTKPPPPPRPNARPRRHLTRAFAWLIRVRAATSLLPAMLSPSHLARVMADWRWLDEAMAGWLAVRGCRWRMKWLGAYDPPVPRSDPPRARRGRRAKPRTRVQGSRARWRPGDHRQWWPWSGRWRRHLQRAG